MCSVHPVMQLVLAMIQDTDDAIPALELYIKIGIWTHILQKDQIGEGCPSRSKDD